MEREFEPAHANSTKSLWSPWRWTLRPSCSLRRAGFVCSLNGNRAGWLA